MTDAAIPYGLHSHPIWAMTLYSPFLGGSYVRDMTDTTILWAIYYMTLRDPFFRGSLVAHSNDPKKYKSDNFFEKKKKSLQASFAFVCTCGSNTILKFQI